MATPRPFLVIVGAKGGVGVTTLSMAIARQMPRPSALVEATGDAHVAALDAEDVDIEIGELLRAPASQLPRLLERYADQPRLTVTSARASLALHDGGDIARVTRAIAATRFCVVDGGRRPHAELLAWATRIWLVVTPDIRSIAQAEALLDSMQRMGLIGRMTLIENCSDGPSLIPDAWRLPTHRLPLMRRNALGALMRGAWDIAVAAALESVFPKPPADAKPSEHGVLRGLFMRD